MTDKLHSASPEVQHILKFFGLEKLHVKTLQVVLNRDITSCSYEYYDTVEGLLIDAISCKTSPATSSAVLNLLGVECKDLVWVRLKIEAGKLAHLNLSSEVNPEAIKAQAKTFTELFEATHD